MHPNVRAVALSGVALAVAGALLAGCASDGSSGGSPADTPTTSGGTKAAANVEQIDLDALAAAAKQEGELTVWDSSSSVKDVAEGFTAKYGIKVDAVKVSKPDQVTKLSREAAGGTPSADVLMFADDGSLGGQLLPQKLVTSWFPADLVDTIPADSQDPPVAVWNPNVFFYNPTTYPGGCPVHNVWELTGGDYKGRAIWGDPAQNPQLADFMTELQLHDTDALAAAYQSFAGSAPTANAGVQFITDLAKNAPIVAGDDDDVIAAVGAKGSDQIGFAAASSWYDAQDQGLDVAVCQGLAPWVGYASPKFPMLVTKAAHQNAAKLWIHYVMDDGGVTPVLNNGGFSPNPNTKPTADTTKIPGLADDHSDLFLFGLDTLDKDWTMRQDTQDTWADNLTK